MLWTSGLATFLNTPWRFPKARQAAGQHAPGDTAGARYGEGRRRRAFAPHRRPTDPV
ncbi:hypothetical protein MUK71_12525 [Arthrobacter zhangbolii]|uniref:Uncharacterized protein n=1 Tax=Arthrobacter zhangbolii TaxID=2886936 RepID=A0ABY4DH56_9MICC|nr:hypothetical protein [Arthrobacter zhangbolii]UON91416.1 hypothetical protein MUK71_12525 [Arthrobacter zhangbolii]